MALAEILEVPYLKTPEPHTSILLCSAVIKGPVEAVRLSKKWRDANVQVMHFCVGLEPTGDPSEKEPEVIGSIHRCAVLGIGSNRIPGLSPSLMGTMTLNLLGLDSVSVLQR